MTKHESFSAALDALKSGERVARTGWNGANMYLFLQHGKWGSQFRVDGLIEGISPALFEVHEPDAARVLPHIVMVTPSGSKVPWLCSQTDALAEDWVILKDGETT